MTKKIIGVIFTLIIAMNIGYTNVEASTANKTIPVTTGTKASLMVPNCGVQYTSTEASFKVTGLPTNAVITKIEVMPSTATSSGAQIIPNTYRFRSSNSANTYSINASLVKGGKWTTTDLNNTSANGTYYFSFTGTGYETPQLMLPSLTTGTFTYAKPQIVIYYQY